MRSSIVVLAFISFFSIANPIINQVAEYIEPPEYINYATTTPGHYISYTRSQLVLKIISEKGFDTEYSINLIEHDFNASLIRAYYDNGNIWIHASNTNTSTLDKYKFNGKEIVKVGERLQIPNSEKGNVIGVYRDHLFIGDDFATNERHTAYLKQLDINNDFSIVQEISTITTSSTNTVTMYGNSIFWNVNNTLQIFNINDQIFPSTPVKTIEGYRFSGIIDHETVLLNSSKEYSDPWYTYQLKNNDVNEVRKPEFNNYIFLKVDDSWSAFQIEADLRLFRTTTESLVSWTHSFQVLNNSLVKDKTLITPFDATKAFIWFSNISESRENELYALVQKSGLEMLKLSQNNELVSHLKMKYPINSIVSATALDDELYVLTLSDGNLNLLYFNNTGELINNVPLPSGSHFVNKFRSFNNKIYIIMSDSSAAICTRIVLSCEFENKNNNRSDGSIRYKYFFHKDYMVRTFDKSTENQSTVELYNMRTEEGWFEIVPDLFKHDSHISVSFGDYLRLNKTLYSIVDNKIQNKFVAILVNDNNYLPSKDSIALTNDLICDTGLFQCYSISKGYLIKQQNLSKPGRKFSSVANSNILISDSGVQGKQLIFKIKDDISYAKLIQLPPNKTKETLQGEVLKFSFNDYFENIEKYENLTPSDDTEFELDILGNLEVQLENKHTYEDRKRSLSGYIGYTDSFSIKIPKIELVTRDVNDSPFVPNDKLDLLSVDSTINQELLIDLRNIFRDPEFQKLTYDISDLPAGLRVREEGIIVGSISKSGRYSFNVNVSDDGIPSRISPFSIALVIRDESGNIANKNEKNDKSSGSIPVQMLSLFLVFFGYRVRK